MEEWQNVLGFDPGGKSGVAILRIGANELPVVDWGTVTSIDAAIDWYVERLNGTLPIGIGIDTPLSWETGPCGWRGPDCWLRRRYPAVAGSVVSTNSAYGAMVVQGVALALRLRQRFEKLLAINETHPKVLYYALACKNYPREPIMPTAVCEWLFSKLGISPAERYPRTSDEWDAVISAWAAWQGLTGCWKHDLMETSRNPLFPAGGATYFWPV
jgi:hypothetical protein